MIAWIVGIVAYVGIAVIVVALVHRWRGIPTDEWVFVDGCLGLLWPALLALVLLTLPFLLVGWLGRRLARSL